MKKLLLVIISTLVFSSTTYSFDIWTWFNQDSSATGPGSFDSMKAIGIGGDILLDWTRIGDDQPYSAKTYIDTMRSEVNGAYNAGVRPLPTFFHRILEAQQITFQIDTMGDRRYAPYQNYWRFFKCQNVGVDTTEDPSLAPSQYVRYVAESTMSAGIVFDSLCIKKPEEGSWNFDSWTNRYVGSQAIKNNYIWTNGNSESFTAYIKIKTDSYTLALPETTILCSLKIQIANVHSFHPSYTTINSGVIQVSDLKGSPAGTYVAVPFTFTLYCCSQEMLNFRCKWLGRGNLWFDEIEVRSERYNNLINDSLNSTIDSIIDAFGGDKVSYF